VSPERHLRWSLALAALFLAMGLWLEAMIGLRAAGWVDDPLRREFLRLGHAHGALLALLNVGLAWAQVRLATPEPWARQIRRASLAGGAAGRRGLRVRRAVARADRPGLAGARGPRGGADAGRWPGGDRVAADRRSGAGALITSR
jgi:hypothetical protein